MGKRTAEKADSEKGLSGNAQSLKQSSLRCGTRFVGAAEEPRPRLGMPPAKRIPRCRGTRSSFMAESFWGVPSPETRRAFCYSLSQVARRFAISSPQPESLSFGVSR